MKRIIALLLGIMILFSGMQIQAAEKTLEQKANQLNQLGILKGDGKSYNLPGTLTRQEAATFIVRLLGVEQEVLNNKKKYSNVSFSDVKSSDWAAPYIGYCIEKGIINGYTDGKFRPTAKLELQAFAKLLLVSMGYVYDKDFTWDNTLKKAQDIRLVMANEVTIAKNNPFTRGDVVKLLDRILPMKNVQTEKEMFYNLLRNEGVTESTLASLGFVRKEGQNVVEDIKELSAGRFTIRFNVPPKTFSADNMILVEDGGRNLKVKSIKPTDLLNVFIVDTDQPAENSRYQILVRNVVDKDNNYFKEYKKEMVALRKDGLESDLFRISKIKVMDAKNLEVEFTHPIDESMQNSSYYSVKKDKLSFISSNEIKAAVVGEKKVRLQLLTRELSENQYYSLVVSKDAVSKLGVRVNLGTKDDELLFKGEKAAEAKFDIISIELLDKYTIRLTANKKIRRQTAEQTFSYYLTDSSNQEIKINKAVLLENNDDMEQSVLLTTASSLQENRSYVLLVNQMYTVDRDEEIIEKKFPFNTSYSSSGTYDLRTASQIDPYTVEFEFDTAMDQRTATNPANYYVRRESSGKTYTPAAVYYDFENGKMMLYFKEAIKENNMTTYVLYAKTDIKGAAGEQRKEPAKVKFEVDNPDVKPVAFEKVNYIGDSSIQVLFDEPIAKEVPNLDVDNFHIVEKETGKTLYIVGVRYINGKRLSLTVQNYDATKTYELKVKEIKEFNGVTIVKDLPAMEVEKGNLVQ